MEQRLENLIAYCQGIFLKENGKMLYDRYLKDIETITPIDLIYIENEQLVRGMTPKEMLTFVDKLINVFYKYLKSHAWERPKEGTFLYYLMKENEAFVHRLKQFKEVVKQRNWKDQGEETIKFLEEMLLYEDHLLKLENILFPTLEKKRRRFNGMQIMWALHDDVRKNLKGLKEKVRTSSLDPAEINVEIGLLYFQLYGLVQKQEWILFPAATEVLDEGDFEWMQYQSREYGFPYIEPPDHFTKPKKESTMEENSLLSHVLNLETGNLTLDQIKAILNVLPLDLTFVDEKDQVVYFSRPKERIFPRSVAILGRNVRNCHPPDSVHVVEEILEAFKSGKREQASFWIQRNGQFILIHYVALHDDGGDYLGTLEISQELSEVRSLTGERRLLDWNQNTSMELERE